MRGASSGGGSSNGNGKSVARSLLADPNARILIVDDEPANTMLLGEILSAVGYQQVETMSDPTRALERVEVIVPDLIVLDLNMPGMDGFEILRSIRRDHSGEFLPVLVITGDHSHAVRSKALSTGATDFLTKPIDATEVMLRIDNLLRTRVLHRQIRDSNALLEAKVTERTHELEEAHAEMLVRLALAAEYRDDATGEHTWRVGFISARLAELLGDDAAGTKLMERAARLHDVGKIGIPDRVLLKPGRLSDDEMSLMKQHTTIGANLLSGGRSQVLQVAERVALTHHERWNGSGYPRGLVGEEIPREGRIVAVADVFDALVHQRTYKDSWPAPAAIEYIRNQRGEQFEPSVVDAFMHLAEQGTIIDIKRPADARFSGVLPPRAH